MSLGGELFPLPVLTKPFARSSISWAASSAARSIGTKALREKAELNATNVLAENLESAVATRKRLT